MNTLTKNRILQKGDEYRDNGEWKPVPKENIGLQVMFTPYPECRRPSEKPQVLKAIPVSPRPIKPISPDGSTNATKSAATVTAKAEKVKTPVPTPSGTGETPSPEDISRSLRAKDDYEDTLAEAHSVAHLPTIVSTKAHKKSGVLYQGVPVEDLGGTPETGQHSTRTEVAKSPASPTPSPVMDIDYAPKAAPSIWIGRNGTYKQRGMFAVKQAGVITFMPKGKRGRAKNAKVEIPVSEAAALGAWILEQTSK
jgi:hypothetical protein